MDRPVADRVVLDTNVLLAATDEGRSAHADAVAALDLWPALGVSLYTSGQIIREYLCVATRPVDSNGLGLGTQDALSNARSLRGRMHLLSEDRRVADELCDLLDGTDCAGKQVHDANLVATMLVHGVAAVVTANVEDFERFVRHITVVELA
jgi:predicted nucleic acid-binding protein